MLNVCSVDEVQCWNGCRGGSPSFKELSHTLAAQGVKSHFLPLHHSVQALRSFKNRTHKSLPITRRGFYVVNASIFLTRELVGKCRRHLLMAKSVRWLAEGNDNESDKNQKCLKSFLREIEKDLRTKLTRRKQMPYGVTNSRENIDS